MYICMYFSNKPRKKSPRVVFFLQQYSRFPLQTHTHTSSIFFVASLLQAHCYHLVNNRSARSMIFHSASGRLGLLVLGWEGSMSQLATTMQAATHRPHRCRSSQQRCELRHTVPILKTVLWSTSQTYIKNYSQCTVTGQVVLSGGCLNCTTKVPCGTGTHSFTVSFPWREFSHPAYQYTISFIPVMSHTFFFLVSLQFCMFIRRLCVIKPYFTQNS